VYVIVPLRKKQKLATYAAKNYQLLGASDYNFNKPIFNIVLYNKRRPTDELKVQGRVLTVGPLIHESHSRPETLHNFGTGIMSQYYRRRSDLPCCCYP